MRIFASVVTAVLLSIAPMVAEAVMLSRTVPGDTFLQVSDGYLAGGNGLHVSDGYRVGEAGATFGQEPDPSVIVLRGGLEWIWAAPCASEDPSCGKPTPHHGFRIPTALEWTNSWVDRADLVDAFDTPQLCGSPWMSPFHNHCDSGDFVNGHIWHAFGFCDPNFFNGCEASTTESFFVRGAQRVPEPASLALVLSGFGLAAWMSRRRTRPRQS